jgi:hypothetical protein
MNPPAVYSYYSCLTDAWAAAVRARRPIVCAIGIELWWVTPAGTASKVKSTPTVV